MLNYSDLESLADCFSIPEYPDFSTSIEENLWIPQSESFYSFWRTPFFRKFADLIERLDVEEIGLMLPSQIGKSMLLTAISLEFARRNANSLILYYTPDLISANSFVREKLRPCCENSQIYSDLILKCKNAETDRRALKSQSISFINGSEIRSVAISGKTALVSKTSPLIILDEYSRMSLQKNQGDLLSLARTRSAALPYQNRKIVVASTPLSENSDIDSFVKSSKVFSWQISCPKCGKSFIPKFSNLYWEKSKSEKIADDLQSGKIPVFLKCPDCEALIEESEKKSLLNSGSLVCVSGSELSNSRISFNCDCVCGLEKWQTLAARFISAKSDPMKLREFVNQSLAQPWKSVSGSKIEASTLPKHSDKKGILPSDTVKIICSIDVQRNRTYSVFSSYTKDKKIKIFDWRIDNFDLSDAFNKSSFLYKLRAMEIDGKFVDSVVIDSGDNSQTVYKIAVENDFQAIKGFPRNYGKTWKKSKSDLSLLLVSVQDSNDYLQNLLDSKILLFPDSTTASDEIVKHLQNVVKIKNTWQDRYTDARTDYRDCLRYLITFCDYSKLGEKVDSELYHLEHKTEIEAENRKNVQALNQIFSIF